MSEKIHVFDLDLTFVNVNTFHCWMKFLVKTFWYNPKIIAAIIKITLKRYLRLCKHSEMKREILRITNKYSRNINISGFVDFLEKKINKKVFEHYSSIRNEITILATAAPDIYAIPFGKKLGFTFITATSSLISDDWVENIKEQKCISVQKIIHSNTACTGKNIEIITDHHDDLPLMKLAGDTILVNPGEKTVSIVKNNSIKYSVFQCESVV